MDFKSAVIDNGGVMKFEFLIMLFVFSVVGAAYIFIKNYIYNIRDKKQYQKDLDFIEQHGYKAHRYFPATNLEYNYDLYAALSRLQRSHIMTDADGKILGKVSTVRPDRDQLALELRAQFSVVKK